MKHFFRHWHYGIKTRVIDGALVANIDTAREPAFVRLELARLQTIALDVATKPGEYELNLVNIGAPAAATTLAKFEVKDAAEEAAACIRCALLKGSQTHRFRRAFKTTLGIVAALALVVVLMALLDKLDGGAMSGGSQQSKVETMLQNMQGTGAGSAAPASSGQPMSAEQFLSGAKPPAE